MQQRGINISMDVEPVGQITTSQNRGRNNSKLKVLVRSHAMREEASPPREPTPTALSSPCIKLTPSSDRPVLVLSPPASHGNSPSHTPNLSPTSTLVPSPQRHSPQPESEFTNLDASPRINRLNRQNLERFNSRNLQKTDIIVEETSHRKNKCDCPNHNCNSCLPPERNFNNNLNNNNISPNTLTVNRGTRGKLRHQSSSQGSFEGSASNSPCLSRDNSSEQYTDTTGIDLELFIPETLNRNAKDRALMLRIEEELVQLAKDKGKTHFKFPPMSSYQRMLVHRCAAYFGMDHNIESSGKCVVVNKTKNTRIPDVEFKHHVKEDIVFSEEPRRSILKRDSNSVEDYNFKSPDRHCGMENRRSKSFEEREEEYEKARRRIFNKEMHECGSADDLAWADMSWTSADSESLSRYRLSAEHHHHIGRSPGRLLKVQSEETGEETLRPCVSKSYSFGGYGGVLTRGDSVLSTHSAGPRLFTKQDSAASSVSWRLSPSSSGYKTQSQRSESVTPSPTSTPYLSGDSARQDSTNSTTTNISDIHQDEADANQVVWAVTNISNVPKGSVIINPQTGQPMKNQDGSVYHFDPDNPPPDMQTHHTNSKPPPSPTKTLRERPPSPKKRTRSSPIKKTNTATSPSLPYTPPPPTRVYSFPQSSETLPQQPPAHQYPVYGPSYPPDSSNQIVYQQPCIVFTPYGTPITYDGRVDNQVQEVPNYYSLSEPSPPTQPMTYQNPLPPPPVWNQPYYQNNQQNTRYAVPIPQGAYITPYQPNYIPPQNIPPQNPEVLPMYQQPTVLYPPQPNQSIYPNMYTQYSTPPVFPPSQNISYPLNTPTPTGTAAYQQQVFDQTMQSMAQLSLAKSEKPKYTNSKGMCSSSQSSTETSSPAMTVIAGYCNQYRQTPDTPPASAGYGSGGFVSPMLFRPMNNVRASPPVTSRSSRSPTPANEAHIERQRYPLTPIMYQGMPYSIQADNRIVSGRGQPTAYRQSPFRQPSINPPSDNKGGYKNRKPRGNKAASLPPNGRQHN